MTPLLRAGLAGVLVLVAALPAACGGDDDGGGDGATSDAERPYIDAFIRDATEDEDFAATEAEAGCFGRRVVRIFGADELENRGITPEEFAEAESLSELDLDVPEGAAAEVSAALSECYDDITGLVTQALTGNVGEGAGCLTEGLDETKLVDALAQRFIEAEGSDEALAQAVFADASPACAERLLIGAAVEDGSVPERAADCLADELDDEVALRVLQAGVREGDPEPEDAKALERAAAACA